VRRPGYTAPSRRRSAISEAPRRAVAFGRIDTEDDEVYYVGYNAIWDDRSDILVVNWQAPVAQPYFGASTEVPMGLVRRRDFTVTEQNQITEFDDLVFAELAAQVAELEEPSDALLKDLARTRTGEMLDIVRTIQAAQFAIVSAPLDQLLVVQGGPGTGKTAIALHRVSWLLFNHRQELKPADVLIVGPNRTFVRYIKGVLPSLGDRDVDQRSLTELAPAVAIGRGESNEVARLKGDLRMVGLINRGLADRISVPREFSRCQPVPQPSASSETPWTPWPPRSSGSGRGPTSQVDRRCAGGFESTRRGERVRPRLPTHSTASSSGYGPNLRRQRFCRTCSVPKHVC
jgi:hypothetical protein